MKKPENWLHLSRKVRFGDTDAAGVMHFHQLLRWSHEAWEESLENYGISPFEIFPGRTKQSKGPDIALPIVHCSADFLMPVMNGDQLMIKLTPSKVNSGAFKVRFLFQRDDDHVANGLLHHFSINATSRKRCALPKRIDLWLEASSTLFGIHPT